METELKVRVKSEDEMKEWFNFDEVLYIKYYKGISENVYEVIVRTAECDLKCNGITTLQRIKERVVKRSGCYPIKSKVTFADGTERIMYASNEYWENCNANYVADNKLTKVLKIERL